LPSSLALPNANTFWLIKSSVECVETRLVGARGDHLVGYEQLRTIGSVGDIRDTQIFFTGSFTVAFISTRPALCLIVTDKLFCNAQTITTRVLIRIAWLGSCGRSRCWSGSGSGSFG